MNNTYTGSQLDISSVMSLSYQQLFGQREGVEGVGIPLREKSRRRISTVYQQEVIW